MDGGGWVGVERRGEGRGEGSREWRGGCAVVARMVEGTGRALHDGKTDGGGRKNERSSQNGGQAQACEHIVRENSIILHDVTTLYIISRLILRTRVHVLVLFSVKLTWICLWCVGLIRGSMRRVDDTMQVSGRDSKIVQFWASPSDFFTDNYLFLAPKRASRCHCGKNN